MKKVFLGVAIFATTVITAFAGGPELIAPSCPNANFDGFYAGIGIGTAQAQFKISSNTRFANPNNPTSEFFNTRHQVAVHDGNVLGNAFVGYGRSFRPIYLGVELYGNVSPHKSASSSGTTVGPGILAATLSNSTNARLNDWEGGVDLRPGVLLGTSTLLYGRVGAAFNKLKFNTTSTITVANDSASFINGRSKSVTGLRVGGGMEQMLTQSLALRADYIYTNYGRINGSGSATIAEVFVANNSSVRANNNTTILSLIYHFN